MTSSATGYDDPVPTARRTARRIPRRRIRLDNDQRRAQLLELAKTAFSGRAYDDVSIDDLARVAGISKGLLYHYFPTKRDLYVAGLTEIADELVDACTNVPDDLPPIERVRQSIDAYLDHIGRHAPSFVRTACRLEDASSFPWSRSTAARASSFTSSLTNLRSRSFPASAALLRS